MPPGTPLFFTAPRGSYMAHIRTLFYPMLPYTEWETWDSDHSEVHKKDSSDDYESSYVKRRRKKSKLSSSSSTGVSLTGVIIGLIVWERGYIYLAWGEYT